MVEQLIHRDYTHGHLFDGVGGAAMGLNAVTMRLRRLSASFHCVGAIDVDPAACRAFEANVHAPATMIIP
jgi:site-specific DNA-cytosine methylase